MGQPLLYSREGMPDAPRRNGPRLFRLLDAKQRRTPGEMLHLTSFFPDDSIIPYKTIDVKLKMHCKTVENPLQNR